jgi:hypothetical protein
MVPTWVASSSPKKAPLHHTKEKERERERNKGGEKKKVLFEFFKKPLG